MTFRQLIIWMFEYEPLDETAAGRVLKHILTLLTRRPYRRLPPGEDGENWDPPGSSNGG